MEEPRLPDHYWNLGVKPYSTSQEIKRAFFRLAKIHHPDKQAPGMSTDAEEFRKIREAQETLCDEIKRRNYDMTYPGIQFLWAEYRKRSGPENTARRKADADAARKAQDEWAAQMAEREKTIRAQKQKEADERSKEAGRKARGRQEQEASGRIRKEQEAEKEEEKATQQRIAFVAAIPAVSALPSPQSSGTVDLGGECSCSSDCANGADCYAVNSMLIPTCGNFQASCTTDSQCAYNTCVNAATSTTNELPLGSECIPNSDTCANGADCYATNSMLHPRCGNFAASCSSDSQCAYNACNTDTGLCTGSTASSMTTIVSSPTPSV